MREKTMPKLDLRAIVKAALCLAGLALAGQVWAQSSCPCVSGAARVNSGAAINTLLLNNTVCAVLGSDRWQEWHDGANIKELGDNFASPAIVGTWSTTGSGGGAIVTYAYNGGSSYSYNVCTQGSNVHFCATTPAAGAGGRNVTNATLVAGKGSCGFTASAPSIVLQYAGLTRFSNSGPAATTAR